MILVALPVTALVAAAVAALRPWTNLPRMATAVAGVLEFLITLDVAIRVGQGATLQVPAAGIGVDGLAAVLLLLQGFVGMTASLYSWGYIRQLTEANRDRERWYHVNLNLFLASLFVVPLLLVPALAWVAVELTTVLSIFLVALENHHAALEAAWKYAVITIMGATAAALGIFLLLWGLSMRAPAAPQTWSAIIAAGPHMPAPLVRLAFVLIVIGFGTKVGFVPLHTWLPDAHSQAPTPVCALLSGVEVSTALYMILRLWPVFTTSPGFPAATWAIVIGLVSVGTAAFLLVQVHDYKRLFAFSTVEHMGILLAALGFGPLGAYAAIYQLLTHGLTKSLAFYTSGGVLIRTGTRDISEIRGLMQFAPWEGWSLLLAGLAIAGAPPFAVFLSEFSVVRSAYAVHDYWAIGLLLGFLLIAFLGILWQLTKMLFGTPHSDRRARSPRSLPLTVALSAVPVVLLGVYLPAPLHHLFQMAAMNLRR